MAGLIYAVSVYQFQTVVDTLDTLVQIKAPTNQRLRVVGYGVAFSGTSVTETPIEVQLLWQTTDGTGTAATEVKYDGSLGETVQGVGQVAPFSAEPTAGDVIKKWYQHPQVPFEVMLPADQAIWVGGGDRVALNCTPEDASPPFASAFIVVEE